jgi:YbgC/YbaW family acyl-CoA thioester hydrolase
MSQARHRLRRLVHFHETDGAGIVHFSWYFRYAEEAEQALWRSLALRLAPDEQGIMFPRVAATFDFHSPLRFDDEFDIEIGVAGLTDKTIRYAVLISIADRAVATGAMTVACATQPPGEAMRAVPIPAPIREALMQSTIPGNATP